MTSIDEHQFRLQQAIIDVLCYSTVFRHALSEEEIFQYLPIATMQIAHREALRQLLDRKKIIKIGNYYGLARFKYPNPHNAHDSQVKLLNKAEQYAQFFGMVPAIESIVMAGSGGFGNATKNSDINLVVIARPHRVYIAKGALHYALSILHQRATAEVRGGHFALNLFLTTGGVNFKKDIMSTPDPQLAYWLVCAKPLFGSNVWYSLMKQQSWLVERFPNYTWPKVELTLPRIGFKPLDALDEIGYRRHLQHVAKQSGYKKAGSFLRLRPDIINQNTHDKSAEIAQSYAKILARHHLTA